MATTTKDPILQERAHLVRLVDANLKVSFLDAQELRFRGSLLRKAAAELPNLNSTQVTRLYEAACDVKFPSEEVTTFRAALQRRIGSDLNLKEYKA